MSEKKNQYDECKSNCSLPHFTGGVQCNVISHLSSEQTKMKWTIIEKKYALRSITNKDIKVPEKPKLKCMVLNTMEQSCSTCYPLK